MWKIIPGQKNVFNFAFILSEWAINVDTSSFCILSHILSQKNEQEMCKAIIFSEGLIFWNWNSCIPNDKNGVLFYLGYSTGVFLMFKLQFFEEWQFHVQEIPCNCKSCFFSVLKEEVSFLWIVLRELAVILIIFCSVYVP